MKVPKSQADRGTVRKPLKNLEPDRPVRKPRPTREDVYSIPPQSDVPRRRGR